MNPANRHRRQAETILNALFLALLAVPCVVLLINALKPWSYNAAQPQRFGSWWERGFALRSQDWREPEFDPRSLLERLPGISARNAAPRDFSLRRTLNDFVETRFGGRAWAIAQMAWFQVQVCGRSPSTQVLLGQNDWLFYRSPGLERDIRRMAPLSAPQLEHLAQCLLRGQQALARRKIRFLAVMVPEKPTLYPEYLPAWLQPLPAPSRADQLVRRLAGSGIELLDLRPALLDEKQAQPEPIYQRCDSHWNDLGAWRAHSEILERLRRWFPRIGVPRLESVQRQLSPPLPGDLSILMASSDQPRFRERLPEIVPLGAEPIVEENLRQLRVETGSGKPAAPRAVILRDSYAQRLIPFLTPHFQHALWLWQYPLLIEASGSEPRLNPAIEQQQPDIVIMQFTERVLFEDERFLDALD